MCDKFLDIKTKQAQMSKKYELSIFVLSRQLQGIGQASFTLLLPMWGYRMGPVLILVTLAVHVIAVPPPGRRNYTVLSTTPLIPRLFDSCAHNGRILGAATPCRKFIMP